MLSNHQAPRRSKFIHQLSSPECDYLFGKKPKNQPLNFIHRSSASACAATLTSPATPPTKLHFIHSHCRADPCWLNYLPATPRLMHPSPVCPSRSTVFDCVVNSTRELPQWMHERDQRDCCSCATLASLTLQLPGFTCTLGQRWRNVIENGNLSFELVRDSKRKIASWNRNSILIKKVHKLKWRSICGRMFE